MTSETDMMIKHSDMLAQLEAELAGLADRRSSLEAAIAALRRLVQADKGQGALSLSAAEPSINGAARHPAIPPGFFASKTPTQAYRDLMKLWPGEYKAPEIADMFIAGGMEPKNRTALVQSIHSVFRRERKRREKEAPGQNEQGRTAG